MPLPKLAPLTEEQMARVNEVLGRARALGAVYQHEKMQIAHESYQSMGYQFPDQVKFEHIAVDRNTGLVGSMTVEDWIAACRAKNVFPVIPNVDRTIK